MNQNCVCGVMWYRVCVCVCVCVCGVMWYGGLYYALLCCGGCWSDPLPEVVDWKLEVMGKRQRTGRVCVCVCVYLCACVSVCVCVCEEDWPNGSSGVCVCVSVVWL